MKQLSEEEGEIILINYKYNKRYAFSWSWWSAYGWKVCAALIDRAALHTELFDTPLCGRITNKETMRFQMP
jgi:hypothetical protein